MMKEKLIQKIREFQPCNEQEATDKATMLNLLEEVMPMVTTDMTSSQMIGYAKDLFPMLMTAELVTQHIPVDGGYTNANIGGALVLVPNMDMNIQALMDSLMSTEEEGVG